MSNEEKKKEEPLVRGVVARGRTVQIDHPSHRRLVATRENGEKIYAPVRVEKGPGEEVNLPAPEIVRLRKDGFLIDPDRKIEETPAEGSHVREQAA